jgi:hypothetical protein
MQNTEMPVGSPEKKSGKLIWPRYKLKWQIKLAQGVANNFGHIPPKVENYHGPRHVGGSTSTVRRLPPNGAIKQQKRVKEQ